MAELSPFEPVVHVSPVWPKRKRPKSFKKVVRNLVKVMRFVQKVKNLADTEISEQNERPAKETKEREERLEKVKRRAKLKADGSEEKILTGWKKCRQRSITYLHYLEKFRPFKENHLEKNLTRNPSSWEKLQHFTTKGKKFQNSIRMNKIVNKYELNESSNEVADVINKRGVGSILAKGRPNQANVLTSTTSNAAEPAQRSQMSSLDPKLDPRFKNLLRSLTPIDC